MTIKIVIYIFLFIFVALLQLDWETTLKKDLPVYIWNSFLGALIFTTLACGVIFIISLL